MASMPAASNIDRILAAVVGTVTINHGLQLKTQGVRIGPVRMCVGYLRRGNHGGSRSLQDADKYTQGHKEMLESGRDIEHHSFCGVRVGRVSPTRQ